MPRKSEGFEEDTPAPAEPCEECGGQLGYNAATGVELKQGHYSSCTHWKPE